MSYGGSSYVAIAANTGRAPDQSPVYWGLLAKVGSTGATGATGTQGPQGPTGYGGPQGPAGATGATGATGAAGPQGLSGPAGPEGTTGATGPMGATGLTYRGTYVSNHNYGLNDAVSYLGSSYLSTSASNLGNSPDQSPSLWSLLAQGGANGVAGAPGSAGATGSQGPQGVQGPAGAAGAQGPAGTSGMAGMHFAGSYLSSGNFALNDAVVYNGSTYISLSSGNHGNTPDQSPAWWSILAQAGAAGSTGPAGPSGAAGSPGATGATGLTGATGATGQAGAVGINYRGSWNSGTGYQANDAVYFSGSTYLAQMSNSSSEPDLYPAAWTTLAAKGDAGPTGPSGSAGTLNIGTVTTGAPGSAATVTNSGTATAAVLNFSIPQGPAGAAGAAGGSGTSGSTGTSGVAFQSMYHGVSYLSTYYSVSSTNASTSEANGSVLTWVPGGCSATKLMVYSMQGNTITVKLRQGPFGALADTSLACTVASGGSCTATGAVTVDAGYFIDLGVSGANSTSAAVWTAVACN